MLLEERLTLAGGSKFLVRWDGYGADEDTWEPQSRLSVPDLMCELRGNREI